jgi:hypothetical protein
VRDEQIIKRSRMREPNLEIKAKDGKLWAVYRRLVM